MRIPLPPRRSLPSPGPHAPWSAPSDAAGRSIRPLPSSALATPPCPTACRAPTTGRPQRSIDRLTCSTGSRRARPTIRHGRAARRAFRRRCHHARSMEPAAAARGSIRRVLAPATGAYYSHTRANTAPTPLHFSTIFFPLTVRSTCRCCSQLANDDLDEPLRSCAAGHVAVRSGAPAAVDQQLGQPL